MVTLNRIYTKTGDAGETSLGDGTRVHKDELRVAAMGDVDELNAAIGIARLHVTPELDAVLARIQNDLFDLGADLCLPLADIEPEKAPLRIVPAQVTRLEHDIDTLNAALAPLKSFVLPGGTPGAAHLHLARATARRAERTMVALAREAPLNVHAFHYINRVSDLLFVMARGANHVGGAGDVLWVPGENR